MRGLKYVTLNQRRTHSFPYWLNTEAQCHFKNTDSRVFGLHKQAMNSNGGGCTYVCHWISSSIFGFQQKKKKKRRRLSSEFCSTWERWGWAVWYSWSNTKSAWGSAADVKVLLTSSIFLPVPSRPQHLQCFRAASNCAEWKVRNQGLLRATSPLGHRRLWESTAVSAAWPKHASYGCLTLACKTMLSVCTQTARAREYINQRPHTDLDGKLLLWLHIFIIFFDRAKTRYIRRTRGFSGGLRLVLWIMQHDIVWLNAPSPNWIPSDASSPPCLDKHWWKITASALIKEMGHFDPTLN